jgi:peptide/nickel transport system substrate-binding protein
VSGPEGGELVSDLAETLPIPTDGGLTYTFRLKEGVAFGPPLLRPVTSEDIRYAFARIRCIECGAAYPFYYDVIHGMKKKTRKPMPASISGIETPDDRTIVFHLREPAGDFLHRLAMPATTPIPREIASCARGYRYGRNLVSTGPYMVDGADRQLFTSCTELETWSGYRPHRRLRLVPNPAYNPATDSPEVRETPFETMTLRFLSDAYEVAARIDDGRLDLSVGDIPGDLERSYENDPDRRGYLHHDPNGITWYMTMRLSIPPFDDVHVRRALNLALDKAAILRVWGGATEGSVATHILPPVLTHDDEESDSRDAYPTPGHAGDIAAARSEMAASRYDSDGDGLCNGKVCTVKFMDVVRPRFPNGYFRLGRPGAQIAVSSYPGWSKDYIDPFNFMDPLFHSDALECGYTSNYSLVGATESFAEECGLSGNFSEIPNVDDDIDRCQEVVVSEKRNRCWRDLDDKLMREVVPWVPYIWADRSTLVGPRITSYEFDQFSNTASFTHLEIAPGAP